MASSGEGQRGRVPANHLLRASAGLTGLFLLLILTSACQRVVKINGFYQSEQKGFKLKVLPARWVLEEQEGFDMFFRSSDGAATIGVAVDCNRPTKATPEILTRHLLLGIVDRRVLEQKEVSLPQGTALETVLTANLGNAPVRMSLVVFKKDGCIYDLLFVSRPTAFESGLQDFADMVKSLSVR